MADDCTPVSSGVYLTQGAKVVFLIMFEYILTIHFLSERVHFCIAYCQTQAGLKEKFVQDFGQSVQEIMKNPGIPATGTVSASSAFNCNFKVCDWRGT
jgi:hypothetical protein